MAATSTVTVEVAPKVDAEAIDNLVREAVADALRRLADSMTERTGANPTPAPADEPRYRAVVIQGVAGIVDREMPASWAAYVDETDFDLAVEGAVDLNNGDDRDLWEWTRRPTA